MWRRYASRYEQIPCACQYPISMLELRGEWETIA